MEQSEVKEIVKATLNQVLPQINNFVKQAVKEEMMIEHTLAKEQHYDQYGNIIKTLPPVEFEFRGLSYPPYPEMVRNLFKTDPDPINMLMHAAVGIAGESGELRESYSHTNSLKECGDMMFYIEAMRQRLPPVAQVGELSEVVESPHNLVGQATAMDNVHILSCRILDFAKKSWVYKKDVDYFQLHIDLYLLELNLNFLITEVYGSDVETVKRMNQEKLLNGRYKTGSYSDEQARVRADE